MSILLYMNYVNGAKFNYVFKIIFKMYFHMTYFH